MKNIDDIRRENLQTIEAEMGGASRTAEVLGMSPAQYINLRDGARDSKTGKQRGMRSDTARRIDAAAGKAPGWLDADHSGQTDPAPTPGPNGWEKLTPDERRAIQEIIDMALQGIVALPNAAPRPLGGRRKSMGD